MAVYVPVPNVAFVQTRQILTGEPIMNTMYFRKGAALAPADLASIGAIVREWWVTDLSSLLTASVALHEVFVTDLTTASSGIASDTTGLPAPGAANTEPEANSLAACISFHTASRGRSFRGRNYIGGLATNVVSGNTLDAGWMASVVDVYEGLLAQALSEGFTMVVVSRYTGYTMVNNKKKPTPRAVGIATPVTTISFTDNVIDNLRNRSPAH